MDQRSSRTNSSKYREPLRDAASWVNTQSSLLYSSSLPRISHHESAHSGASLRIGNHHSSPLSNIEDKRMSALTSEGQRDSNCNSQVSATSTNASKRKTHVGPWRLGRTLGKGSSGRVRKARHAVTGQDAAVKIVSKHVAKKLRTESLANMDTMVGSQASISQGRRMIPFGIEREVVIMKLIEHPHIISLYDVWENRGELYLVLEYIEGGELFHHIYENGRLPEHEAVRIFRQMIAGLSHCHRFNICHRDLKPENILMDRNRNVKIVDFGMAALQPANKWLNTSCGSPHYASPEVIKGQNYRGDKADVWSCGVILYAMLTGTLPFDSEGDYPEVIATVLAGSYTFPKGLSSSAKDLMSKMLQYDPNHRISMKNMWQHPLLKKYESLDSNNASGDPCIGPPAPLTVNDCGEPIKSRDNIDNELLRNLRNLWHAAREEELVQKLLSDEPNFEKVIYTKLLRFREDQLENYQGPPFEYSMSDYHHAPPQAMRRSSTRVSLLERRLGGSRQRVSQYSILEEINPRRNPVNQRKPSVAETEQSYDPFRPSRNQITKTQADRTRIPVLPRLSESQTQRRSGTLVTRRTASKVSTRNPALARAQQADAYSVASSPLQIPSGSKSHINTRIKVRRISPCSSRRSIPCAVPVRMSMSYKRGVSFAHMRRRSPSTHHPRPVARKASPLTPQGRCLPKDPAIYAFSPETPSVADSPQDAPHPIRMPKNTARSGEDPAAQSQNTASQYWKEEDARNISSELEKVCDEAFNRASMSSSVVTAAHTEADPRYDSPATSMGILESPQTSMAAVRSKDERDSYLNRPLPLPPSFVHLRSCTYRELARTRALLKERAADRSMVMAPGYFDEVIAHLDRLMQPSTTRLDEKDRRSVSTPDQPPRHSKDEFEMLLARGPYGLRSVSEPLSKAAGKDRATVRMVDEKPISPTKPLTIRKRSVSSDLGRWQGPREQAHRGENTRSYERPQEAERRVVGHSLLDHPLEPIEEDEDKENRDPRNSKTISGDAKKRGWFRRPESAQRSQDTARGPPLPPKNEALLQYHDDARDKSRKRGSEVSDESRVSETKKISSAKERFFKIFSKRGTKESKNRASTGYDLNDTVSITTSTTSSQTHHTYMTGALQNLSMTSVMRGRRTSNKQEKKTKSASQSPRAIQPQHQNWFARFLRIKPAVSILCFRISKVRARKEIARVFREWRKYGIRDIVVDRDAGRIWARVAEKNSLNIKPVSLAVELFTILHHGHKANLSVARFTQERGAKSSFNRVMEALESVLMARGLLVEEGPRREDMSRVLNGV